MYEHICCVCVKHINKCMQYIESKHGCTVHVANDAMQTAFSFLQPAMALNPDGIWHSVSGAPGTDAADRTTTKTLAVIGCDVRSSYPLVI